MKITARHFNPSCLKIFQKSLRAFFHSPLQLLFADNRDLAYKRSPDDVHVTTKSSCSTVNCKCKVKNNIFLLLLITKNVPFHMLHKLTT